VISPRGMLDPGSITQRGWRKRTAYRLIERRGLLDAAFLHATSQAEARAVRAWAPGAPVVTLPNGVEAPSVPAAAGSEIRRRLGVPDGAPLVTFLGRIHPIKRLDLLAQAFDRVLAVRPDTRLVIAGPDERGHRGEMEPRFAAPRVHWAGELGETDKWALLSASSLLVLCSDSESFGLSAAEAMAARRVGDESPGQYERTWWSRTGPRSRGTPSVNGGPWYQEGVRRLLARLYSRRNVGPIFTE